jgi:ATP-binding cassette subfamily F protein uup
MGFKGCVIVVSHDRFFMDKVVDHILAFEGDAKIKDYPGNYTDYREWKTLQEEQEMEQKTQQKAVEKPKNSISNSENKLRKMSYKEKQEFETLEKDISALETEKMDIETQLSGGETDSAKITELSRRMGEIIDEIDEKTMRWLELSEI